MSTQIPFHVLVGQIRHLEPQKQDGQDKLKISRGILRTKTQLDSTEKHLNSSGKILAGFTTLTILHEIHKVLEEKNIKSVNFKDRIIFGNQMIRIASRTLKKSRITQRGSYQDIGLFWVLGQKIDGTVTLKVDSGTVQPKKMVQQFKETGHLIFISTLSRGILKQRR